MSLRQSISDLWFRLRALAAPGRMDRELDEEVRFHLEQETAKHRARGLGPSEARRAALRGFGGVERNRELARDARGVRFLETVWFDARLALRSLRRTPAVTGAALATMVLAVGATTLIWAVVDAVLLRPLPYPEPDRLVQVWESHPDRTPQEVVARGNYLDWLEQNRSFEGMGAYMPGLGVGLTGEGTPVQVTAASVTPSLLDLLGVRAPVGRSFVAAEGEPGGDDAALLSDGFWHRRYGGDPGVVGRILTLDGDPYRVVGVLPPGFDVPSREVDLWLPMAFPPAYHEQRKAHTLHVVGRLRSGVSLAAADAEMDAIEARLDAEHAEMEGNWSVTVVPLHEELVGPVRPALLVLLGAVGLLLVAGCFNVANLLLARGAARVGEIAMRSALGASRGRLVRQLLTESLVLALAGGALGALLAVWGLAALQAALPDEIPRLAEAALDARVLLFTFLVSAATGVAFGALPALRDSRPDLRGSLGAEGTEGSAAAGPDRLRPVLVAAQVGLALVLLVGAGLLIRSFLELSRVDYGFEPRGLLAVSLNLPGAEYSGTPAHAAFYEGLLERVRSLPGVTAAAATSEPPVVGYDMGRSFELEPDVADRAGEESVFYRVVTDDYFDTLGIARLAGRTFGAVDRPDTPPVLVVNRSFAQRYWPGESAVGRRLAFDPEGPWHEVIGVVADTRHGGLEKPVAPAFYAPLRQKTWQWLTWMTVLVRTDGDPLALADAVRAEVWEMDADLPLLSVRTVEQIYADSVARRRFDTLVVSLFAGFALLLGLVGLYGVMAFSVALRRREIGVRMALGARSRTVTGLVLRQGAVVVACGLVVGLVAALAAARLLASQLYGVEPHDPATFAAVAAALGALSLLACWLPARRAARIDPVEVLK